MTNDIKRMITILTPCFNEVDNVEELVDAIINIGKKIPDIKMKHLFIDNASTDGTVQKLRTLSDQYDHIQVILNNRNYGHIRSPMHGIFQSEGAKTFSGIIWAIAPHTAWLARLHPNWRAATPAG